MAERYTSAATLLVTRLTEVTAASTPDDLRVHWAAGCCTTNDVTGPAALGVDEEVPVGVSAASVVGGASDPQPAPTAQIAGSVSLRRPRAAFHRTRCRAVGARVSLGPPTASTSTTTGTPLSPPSGVYPETVRVDRIAAASEGKWRSEVFWRGTRWKGDQDRGADGRGVGDGLSRSCRHRPVRCCGEEGVEGVHSGRSVGSVSASPHSYRPTRPLRVAHCDKPWRTGSSRTMTCSVPPSRRSRSTVLDI